MLPTTYEYKGKEIPIDLAFDNVLDMFDVMRDKRLLERDVAELIMILLFGEGVIEECDWKDVWLEVHKKYFESNDKAHLNYDLQGNPMPVIDDNEEEEVTINLVQDAEYIYSSFVQAYNINLFQEHRKMHWLEFRSLLKGLPEDTVMKQIMAVRSWVPDKHDSAERKAEMQKLQEYYKLREEGWING